ncbi:MULTISPECIES: ABC transporter substrate-binding protein [Rhizobium]|jgi:iron complex transport system substrate-binding protein|uniref:Iron complex transport system substrate-binding protein n=1 Tax=Rhizobium miluonense TaxID=411945 RepID=A0ABU1SXU8_9HYPH|nr:MULTISPECIES: ABC transporter substrate-binding protein [Rhizobium]MBB3429031.1 iron complex transport system substrate-binding protein [Rhizobium sp. BK312]MDR6903801.1 iron complex transport system substrate-binding protein [Rhizobium miluonense]
MTGIGRRALLAGLAASWAGGFALRAAGLPDAPTAGAPRIAALDWGIAATLVALGVVPVGVPAPAWYARYVVDPILPSSVVDVGLLFTPNFELLQALAPQLIVATPVLQQAAPMLQRIAPVYSSLLFQPSPDVLQIAERGTLGLADQIGDRASGERLVEATRVELIMTGQRLAGLKDRPLLLASPLDNRHVSLFGPNSLYGAVLRQVGLTLAAPNIAGEFIIVGLEKLGAFGDAMMVLLDSPAAPGLAGRLAENRLWRTFSFVREGRLCVLPAVLGSGGLPSASRFSRLLTAALNSNDGGSQ